MSVSPTGQDKVRPATGEMPDPWGSQGDTALRSGPGDGRLTPAGVILFLRRNVRRIAALAAALFVVGAVLLWLMPVKYAATALVIVDPREQRVTTDQEVLPGIGQDAAALQSLVEIAKSEGFLQPLVEKLKVAEDEEIARGETNPARVLERFRKHLEISRRGLTYVIAMTFVSKDPQRAAYYANAIAEAFVASQTQVRAAATDEAAAWLNTRLKALSERLRLSEDAVAAFKTQYRIVDAGKESTTRQLRVTELTQQVSAARLQAEEAKNRYEQAQRDLKSNVEGSTGSKSDLLNVLRAQLTQLNDQIAQKQAVFGSRHPDLVIAQSQLAELKRQIEVERKRNIANAKSDYESMLDKQKTLEQQLKQLEGEMLVDGQAAVKLQELRREADANRAIYEQFLARYNATNQQRLLQASQTKVASLATPPTRPTRPPLSLLLVALAMVSLFGAIAIVALLESTAARASDAEPAEAAGGGLSIQPERLAPTEGAEAGELAPATIPVLARIPDLPRSPAQDARAQRQGSDMGSHVAPILDALGVQRSTRGRVVLVTSIEAGAGTSSVARALNAVAVDRGLLSVVVEVTPEARSAPSQPLIAGQVQTLKATVRSILRLLSVGPDGSPHGEIRSEFDLVLIDAPPIGAHPEVAEIAAHTDYNLIVVSGWTEPDPLLDAHVSLSRAGRAPTGIVTNMTGRRTAAGGARLAG